MLVKKNLMIRKNPLASLKLWISLILFLFLMTGWSIAAVKPATSTTPFSIAVIPDSQNMVAGNIGGTPTMFYNQVKWIKDNISALNIKFVSQVGDLVNSSGSSTQWTAAVNAMNLLHGAVPYAIAPGNHDSSSGDYNTFNAKFPVSKFINFSWYGDGYNNRNHNSYELFSTNGMDFIIIHLAYNPDASERSWASQILNYYPNHRAIISTHSFLDDDGRTSEGNNIWSDVIKNHDNVFMVVCGHMHYQRYFVYKNNFGHNVHCLLTDYQDDNPQIAKLRYYTFKPGENAVYAYTYSTHKKQSYTDSGSQFKFTYAMTGSSSGSVYPKDFPSANGGDILRTNQALNLNQYLVSGNGTYRFYLQGDGNLVLRNMSTNQALWAAGTNGKGGVQLILQGDGNLVLYTASGSAVWSSMTNGKGAVMLSMQNDGKLVLYTSSNTSVWEKGTSSGGGGTGIITYTSKGGVNNTESTITVSTNASSGDYEIVAIGGSTVVGGDNQPINSSLMTGQGFKLIGVRGTSDKKIEIWIRKNSGQTNIKITGNVNNGKDLGWALTAIKGSGLNLNFSNFTVATYSGGHGDGSDSSATFKTPSGNGFTFGAFFFDDSVELTSAGSGSVLYKTWGFGDGDGIAIVFFQPGVSPPSSVKVNDHDGSSGGEEFVTVSFKSNS